MNWKLVESNYGRSSIKIDNFVPIHWQTWPPQAILVSGWLIGWNLLFWNCLAKWTETWWEAPMECSVLSFLKAEWKVSDTGSANWASSCVMNTNYLPFLINNFVRVGRCFYIMLVQTRMRQFSICREKSWLQTMFKLFR